MAVPIGVASTSFPGQIKALFVLFLTLALFAATQVNLRNSLQQGGSWAELSTFLRQVEVVPSSRAVDDTSKKSDGKSLLERQAAIHNQCNVSLSSMENDEGAIKQLQNSLLEDFAKVFDMPAEPKRQRSLTEDPVQPCMYSFLDFGANIGDSFGKFVDAGFPNSCPLLGKQNQQVHLHLDKGKMVMSGRNDLTERARIMLQTVNRTSDQYCYVGVEGNPVFTQRLQLLEGRIRETVPLPIAAAHFYTETVGTGVDGPTTLFLDTVNKGKNFWGSSIFDTHPDVRRSAGKNMSVAAPVMGLTLSTLVKRAVKKEPGAHVFIKMDIEGGEYPVMNEGIDTLCEYSRAGVRVDLLVEMHPARYLNGKSNPDFAMYQNTTRHKYKECNIYTGDLSGKARR